MRILKIIVVILLIIFSKTGTAQSEAEKQISLNGLWEIIFDSENQGHKGKWHLDENFNLQTGIRQIEVPSCWEEIEKDYEGVAFYRKKFNVPTSWKGKIVELNFEASNYKTEVWLNDLAVGVHEGGYTPFSFRIDNLLKFDRENTLTVRVVGPIILTDQIIDGIGRQEVPMWRGGIVGGIWQSVKLTASGSAKIKDVFIEPQIENNTALFHLELENTDIKVNPVELTLKIYSAGGEVVAEKVQSFELVQGKNQLQWEMKIPDAQYWSIENPYLYKAEIKLKTKNELSDNWTGKFGMREFTLKNNTYHLNGNPMFLKAVFFEGLYPVKIAYPDSREMAIKEIQLAKEAGFNMIRPWRKPPPPIWLDLCDSMGVLTVGSLVVECMNRPIPTPYLPKMVKSELEGSILRDRNRTCVVLWELFNELSRGTIMNQMLHSMSLRARELDPTRLILDESGGYTGANMYLPYSKTPVRFNDIHHYPGSQINQYKYDQIATVGKTQEELKELGFSEMKAPGRNAQPGLVSFLSELGYASWPNFVKNNKEFAEKGNALVAAAVYHKRLEKELKAAFTRTGFDSAFPDFEKYCLEEQRMHGIANKRMIEATRCNPTVNGYCIHALTDGDWILGAGIVDLWRNPKTFAYEMTKEANQKQIISVRVLPRNIYAEKGGKLKIMGVNELRGCEVNMTVTIKSEKGKKVYSKVFQTYFEQGVSALLDEDLKTTNLKGPYEVKLELTNAAGNLLTTNTTTFDVFTEKDLNPPKRKVAVLDPEHSLARFLQNKGFEVFDFDTSVNSDIPVIVGNGGSKNENFRNKVDEVKTFVNKGGYAVFLGITGQDITWGKFEEMDGKTIRTSRVLTDSDVSNLPLNATLLGTEGNYISRAHIVTDNPVFDGLPTNEIMHGVYENIHSSQSICRPNKGKYLAGVISYDQNKNMDIMLRHYNGVGDVYWAADVLEVEHGKGEMLFSTLKIVDNLGKDPVADKILLNMIKFAFKAE